MLRKTVITLVVLLVLGCFFYASTALADISQEASKIMEAAINEKHLCDNALVQYSHDPAEILISNGMIEVISGGKKKVVPYCTFGNGRSDHKAVIVHKQGYDISPQNLRELLSRQKDLPATRVIIGPVSLEEELLAK